MRSVQALRCLLVMLVCLAGCRSATSTTGPKVHAIAPASPPARSPLSPTLDVAIEPGKTVAWCATLQLAWDALSDVHGGPVWVDSVDPQAGVMAASRFPRAWIDEQSTVVAVGPLTRKLDRQIEAAVKQRFGNEAESGLLSSIADLPRDGRHAIALAMFRKEFSFAHPFEKDTLMFSASLEQERRVRGFGGTRDPGKSQAALDQVHVLWHSPGDDEGSETEYVVEVQTQAAGERLILSHCPRSTLREAVMKTMSRVRSPNTSRFDANAWTAELEDMEQRSLATEGAARIAIQAEMESRLRDGWMKQRLSDRLEEDETFLVPNVRLDALQQFSQLLGTLTTAGAIRRIDDVRQLVRFSLNERGASIESEAVVGGLFGTEPRRFVFGRGFLILLVHRDAPMPYFAMWVGDADVLEPVPDGETPATATGEGKLFGD